MLIVSDVHGAFDALADVIATGETVLVLGDLINLMDYRTGTGLIADVMGGDFGQVVSERRARSDYEGMRALWVERMDGRDDEVRAAMADGIAAQYEECRRALEGGTGYVTYGNVDRPAMLKAAVPESMAYVDGDVVEIDGVTFGFVGGGVATPVGAAGEVSDDEMEQKLAAIGPVEILCSHLPPDIEPLHRDVVTGHLERSSRPILEYLKRHRPRRHFFGDVHQPQAVTWQVGPTSCRNVGYFRATKRPYRLDLQAVS